MTVIDTLNKFNSFNYKDYIELAAILEESMKIPLVELIKKYNDEELRTIS